MRWIVLPFTVLMLVGCSGAATTDSSGLDALAKNACGAFARTYLDGKDGLLTDAEFRDRVKSIHDKAQYSDTIAVRDGARTLLAAVTSGTADESTSAMLNLTRAC